MWYCDRAMAEPFTVEWRNKLVWLYAVLKGGLTEFAGQLKFPATQNPSTDANTFDDYEEIAVVPTVTFGGAAANLTYTTQTGSGHKVGNRFRGQIYVVINSNGTSTGQFKIVLGSAPVAKNTANLLSAVAIRANGLTGVSGSLQGSIQPNSNVIAVDYLGTGTVTDLSDTKVPDGASFIVNFDYETET